MIILLIKTISVHHRVYISGITDTTDTSLEASVKYEQMFDFVTANEILKLSLIFVLKISSICGEGSFCPLSQQTLPPSAAVKKNHPPSEYRCHFDVGNYRRRILDIDSSVFAHPVSQRPTAENTSNRRRCRCLISMSNRRRKLSV